MPDKVVLLDLENNVPTAQLFKDILELYTTLYIFKGQGMFEFPLADLTTFASWVSSGQIVVLDTLTASEKEFEYAVVVGQLIALIDPETHIEVISAVESGHLLVEMIAASGFRCGLIQIQREENLAKHKSKSIIPTTETILENKKLQLVKKYCDTLAKMDGKPNTMTKLKNSVSNVLQLDHEESIHLIGMLINLKIVKCQDEQVSFRKKVFKQWVELNLNATRVAESKLTQVDSLLAQLHTDTDQILNEVEAGQTVQSIQRDLFKNFAKIDPVQIEVVQKLNQLKTEKPKDIYALRDLLEELFPESDVRLLLKELMDKGYIYWNGHEVLYSHEMFLN